MNTDTKQNKVVRIGIVGPSGSGKTRMAEFLKSKLSKNQDIVAFNMVAPGHVARKSGWCDNAKLDSLDDMSTITHVLHKLRVEAVAAEKALIRIPGGQFVTCVIIEEIYPVQVAGLGRVMSTLWQIENGTASADMVKEFDIIILLPGKTGADSPNQYFQMIREAMRPQSQCLVSSWVSPENALEQLRSVAKNVEGFIGAGNSCGTVHVDCDMLKKAAGGQAKVNEAAGQLLLRGLDRKVDKLQLTMDALLCEARAAKPCGNNCQNPRPAAGPTLE